MSNLYYNKYLKYKQKDIEFKKNSSQIAAGSKIEYSIYHKCLDRNAQKAFNKIVDNHGNFNYAALDEDLKKDYNFIMTIMTDVTTSIFSKLRPEFRNIESIAKVAIDKHIELFEYVSDRLKDDNDFVKYAIEKNISIYKFISDRLKNDRNFIKELIISLENDLYSVLEKFQDDEEIALIAIKKNPLLLKIAPDIIKDNDNIVDYACILNKSLYIYASPRLQKVQGCKRKMLPSDQCTA